MQYLISVKDHIFNLYIGIQIYTYTPHHLSKYCELLHSRSHFHKKSLYLRHSFPGSIFRVIVRNLERRVELYALMSVINSTINPLNVCLLIQKKPISLYTQQSSIQLLYFSLILIDKIIVFIECQLNHTIGVQRLRNTSHLLSLNHRFYREKYTSR